MEKRAKTQFISGKIRELLINEQVSLRTVVSVLFGTTKIGRIAVVPSFASGDLRERPLIFSKFIAAKIFKGHGEFLPENFVINANDWDGLLRNVSDTVTGSKDQDRINLLKKIPCSRNYLLIAANKDNGFFVVSHFETIDGNGNKLKSLLGRGELFSKSGKPLAPDEFLVAPPAKGSFEGVSGSGDPNNIPKSADRRN